MIAVMQIIMFAAQNKSPERPLSSLKRRNAAAAIASNVVPTRKRSRLMLTSLRSSSLAVLYPAISLSPLPAYMMIANMARIAAIMVFAVNMILIFKV